MTKNPGATGYYYWSNRNPKGIANEPVELIRPDGTLAGVTLRTLQNGWGSYLESDRQGFEELILRLLNGKT